MDKPGSPVKTIKGIIAPSDWDKNDEILGIKIQSPDEEEYQITDPDMMDELIDSLRSEVEITGAVSINAAGEKVIHIETYELLSETYKNEHGWKDDEEYINEEDYQDPDRDICEDLNEDYPEDDGDL
jgi:hypothetical protein